jgi:hypothetical protein
MLDAWVCVAGNQGAGLLFRRRYDADTGNLTLKMLRGVAVVLMLDC